MSDRSHTRFNPLHSAPNLLTLMRICLAPFLVSAILEDRYGLGFGLFVAAGLTDALDGTLARWLRQRTVLGQYLDPVADKLLLSTIFVVLTHKNLIPTTMTVLVFGRDLGNSGRSGHPLCRGGETRVQAQPFRKGQYGRPGDGSRSCYSASD